MGHFILRCDYCTSVSKLGETMTRFDGRPLSSDWIDRKVLTSPSNVFFFDLSATSPWIQPLL